MVSRRDALVALAGLVVLPAFPLRAQSPSELLIYCGITMVKPIKELGAIMESRHGVHLTVSQGGSEDLYEALKLAQVGDIYFPGASSYRQSYLPQGLLGDAVLVGHNVASILVHKGNPKRVTADLTQLLRQDLAMVICDPDTGSIGSETRRILERAGLLSQVMNRAAFLSTDSRNLMQAMKNQQADITLNWRATAFFPENRDLVQVVDLDPAISQPSRLELNLLTFSRNQEQARRFMALAAGPEGQAIFRKHGFFDAAMRGDY